MKPNLYEPVEPGRYGNRTPVDLTRCRQETSSGFSFAQCTRRGVEEWTDPETGAVLRFCRQHHPTAIAEKRKAQSERWRVESAAKAAAQRAATIASGLKMASDVELLAEVKRRGLGNQTGNQPRPTPEEAPQPDKLNKYGLLD